MTSHNVATKPTQSSQATSSHHAGIVDENTGIVNGKQAKQVSTDGISLRGIAIWTGAGAWGGGIIGVLAGTIAQAIMSPSECNHRASAYSHSSNSAPAFDTSICEKISTETDNIMFTLIGAGATLSATVYLGYHAYKRFTKASNEIPQNNHSNPISHDRSSNRDGHVALDINETIPLLEENKNLTLHSVDSQ
ncbi:hypothetical protein [Paraburkholderia hayleyella]|uniref:hypothetical protein n=1 Tax=Paraburkholderia hayleyella TaxID=2152889 RepID=UPI00129275C1|nr:hypothetical protein [Paraburkholderia hayleyella]